MENSDNKTFYVKYLDNQPADIDTHYNGDKKRERHLSTVAHLITAFQTRPGSLLANTDSGLITLHLPAGLDRTSLDQDCFASNVENDTTLDIACPLASFGTIGSRPKKPLIIKTNGPIPMDVDKESVASKIPPRSKSQESFIADNNLDLGNPDDALEYFNFLLKKRTRDLSTFASTAKFKETRCLEYNLGRRQTTYELDEVNNVKVVLAVSGAGKTRMLLELLYKTNGYYLVAQGPPDCGSLDLRNCWAYCNRHPDKTERAIQLLYFVRVSVCNYLIQQGYNQPQQLLLAQLHPRDFFGGCDVFADLFQTLIEEPIFNAQKIVDPFAFVAIDEIQRTLEGMNVHCLPESQNYRPFFSPLIYYSKVMDLFKQLVISGTGIRFEYLKETMGSMSMKSHVAMDYVRISNFSPLSKSQVQKYALQFLQEQQVADAKEISAKISSFELCVGRARFVAFLLDKYMELKDIDVAIGEFISGLSDVESPIFPLKFFKEDFDKKESPLLREVSGQKLIHLISRGLFHLITKGIVTISVIDDVGAAAILYGLGFGRVDVGMSFRVQIQEPAVVECLRPFIPFGHILLHFADQMTSFSQPQMVGYYLEYLVAFALVSNYAGEVNALREIHCSRSLSEDYLCGSDDDSQVFFPDHMCGPDIIYKCCKTRTVYIVQVKFVKKMSKQETVNACDTTEPQKFYCKRNLKAGESGNIVLKGFEEKRRILVAALKELQTQRDPYCLQQLLVTHTLGKPNDYTLNALLVNGHKNPAFFDKVGTGIWQYLDQLREDFNNDASSS